MATDTQITIETLGAKGDGIGRLPDGRRVFVPKVLPGEVVRVSLGEKRDDGVSASVDDLIQTAPQRIQPACKHFDLCGGCVAQHMDAAFYTDFKTDQVRRALAQEGLKSVTVGVPHISPPGSRRRATLAAYRGPERLVLGFNQSRSNTIVDLDECPVLSPRLVEMIPALRAVLKKILTSGQGMDISVVEFNGAVDMVLRPWVKKAPKPGTQLPLFVLERLSEFANDLKIARLTWQNSAADDTDLTPVAWRAPFTVDLSGTIVTPPPGAFLQATREGEAALVQAVCGSVQKKKARIADLFAGCGTFTFALAAMGCKVHAVEGFAPALNALKAAMPGRPVTAEKRDLAREPLGAKELNAYDIIVLDPPRLGAFDQVKMIARSDVKQVTYVSCNPASFARDARVLVDAGFALDGVTTVDQFLWSPHMELVGVFRRK